MPGTAKLVTPPNAYTSVGQTDAASSSHTPFFSTPGGIFVIALICFIGVVTLLGVSCALTSCSKRNRLAQKDSMMQARAERAAAGVHSPLSGETGQQTLDLEKGLGQDAASHVSHTHLPPPTDEERLRFAEAGTARPAMSEVPRRMPVSSIDTEGFVDVKL